MRPYNILVGVGLFMFVVMAVLYTNHKSKEKRAFSFFNPMLKEVNAGLRFLIKKDPALMSEWDRYVDSSPGLKKFKNDFIHHQKASSGYEKLILLRLHRQGSGSLRGGSSAKVCERGESKNEIGSK